MIVFRTETFSDCDNSNFKRAFLVGSLLGSEYRKSFAVDKPDVAALCLKKKAEIIHNEDLERILGKNPDTIIFDLKAVSNSDLLLAEKALKRKTAIIQFVEFPQRIIRDAFIVYQGLEDIEDLTGSDCGISGTEYIVLHNRFIHFNRISKKYKKRVRKIFISLNETFSYREVRNIVDNLIRHGFLLKIDPGKYLKKFNKKTLKRIYPGLKFTGKRDSLARAYFEADISITVPGIRSFESLATGTPSLFIYSGERGKKIAATLESANTGLGIEKEKFLKMANIADIIKEKFSGEKLETAGEEGKKLIDGKGVFRIIEILKEKKLI